MPAASKSWPPSRKSPSPGASPRSAGTLDVLIDGDVPGQPDAFVGRSYADAPEIDGAVYVTGPGPPARPDRGLRDRGRAGL